MAITNKWEKIMWPWGSKILPNNKTKSRLISQYETNFTM